MVNLDLRLLIFVISCCLFAGRSLAQTPTFTLTQLGSDRLVDKPNDLNFGPDGLLWVSERERGVIVRIHPVTAERDEVLSIPGVLSSSAQEGLLGFCFHPDFVANPYVYLSYTRLVGQDKRQRLARYTFSEIDGKGTLADPQIILDNLPASNDHNSGRIIFGPDGKLYYSSGDHGNNQNANYCKPILAQVLPTQAQIDAREWTNYPGSILRLEVDGSIPVDNPLLNGVRSHVYSYGHRNPQGLCFGESGLLYSSEHGPDTDDEINIIEAGQNYGWPRVVGYRDNQAYDYCNWSASANCASLSYDKFDCPADVTSLEETTLDVPNYRDPIATLFTVGDDYDFNDPSFGGSYWARPNVAPPSIAIYESTAIPSWTGSLLVPSLKRGRVYRLKLAPDGRTIVGDTLQHFYTPNRYRDIALDPDGKTFYIVTDEAGNVSDQSGRRQAPVNRRNPSAILKFTLDESSALREMNGGPGFQVFPNPASGEVQVMLVDVPRAGTSLRLYDLAGRMIRAQTLGTHRIVRLDLGGIPAGVYLVQLQTRMGRSQRRIVLQ